MRKKLYISLPITGRDINDIALDIQEARLINYKYDCVTSFDKNDTDESYSYYMGKSIELLLDCDCVTFLRGWQNSKGCRAEYSLARIYGKEIINV